MLEIVFGILVGLLLGFTAGIIPGMHPNFLAALLFSQFGEWWILPATITMLVSAQFFEFIRATYLFVPEESNVLAMHPIFKFVNEGKAVVAIKLCAVGLLCAFMIGIIASPLLVKIVPIVFVWFKPFVPYALLIVATILILRDKKKIAALGVFLLAGIIGYFGLNMLNQPLLILLTGFFGFPILLQVKTKMPKQIKSVEYRVEKQDVARGLGSAFFSSLLLTFIPAVGPAQASFFSRGFLKKTEEFMVAIGAISGFDIIFSSILLFSVGRARIGTLEMLGTKFSFDLNTLIIVLLLALTVAIVSYLVTLRLSISFAEISQKINYRYVAISVAILILGAIVYFDGALGVAFFASAIGIGLLANKLKTSMTHCMGSLIIPTLGYYFFNLIFFIN